MEASLGKRTPSSTMKGFQVGTSIWWSSLLSVIAPSPEDLVCVTLAYLPPSRVWLPWMEDFSSPLPPPFSFGLVFSFYQQG